MHPSRPDLDDSLVRIAGRPRRAGPSTATARAGPVLVQAELGASHRSALGRTEQESGTGARFEGGPGPPVAEDASPPRPGEPSHRSFRRARPPKHGNAAAS